MTSNTPVNMIAVMEAATVTGPAKNLIEFCSTARQPDPNRPDLPYIRPSIATFVRGSSGAGTNAFVSAIAAAGVDVEILPERFRFDPLSLTELRSRILRRNPDFVQTHNVKSHFLFRLTGLHRRFRWIAFHHGYTTTNVKMRAYNFLDRWSLRGAHRVVAVCGAFAEHLQQFGVSPARIRVLHNSVRLPTRPAPDVVAELRRQLRITHDARVVLAIGRMSKEKGLAFLVRAFAMLRGYGFRDARLVLVGDGPERRRLESEIEAAGLADAVHLAGQISDVQPYYALATVLALPSLSEGSPNVILEAMAAGVPIAATAVGGVPELVENGVSGLLVESKNPQAMAGALSTLLADTPLAQRLAAQAKLRVAQSFTPEAFRRALLEIYQEALR